MSATVVIPARYGSTRFPAKIVASETGRPLVQHVVDRVKHATRVGRVIVATDDQRIVDRLSPFGTHCVMTSPQHQSGTDRIAEVVCRFGDEVGDVVVNVQGDEPEIEPEMVDALIERLENAADGVFDMATAATPFPAGADVNDPNLVKVVVGVGGRALYFSRCPIPFRRDPAAGSGNAAYYLHVGIYAYRRPFLLAFASWPPSPLEQTEKLEQLRALEHGRSIYVHKVNTAAGGIDTPEQYAAFVTRWRQAHHGDTEARRIQRQ